MAPLKGGRIKGFGAVAHLRNAEVDGSDPSGEGAFLEAIGAAVALLGSLVGGGSEVAFSFDQHGVVDECGDGFGKSFKSV